MTKRTNMNTMMDMVMNDMMKEIMETSLIKYSLEMFRREVTKAIAAARADEEHVEFSIERKDEFERGFRLLLQKSGVKGGKKYQEIAVDWMNYLNDSWKLDSKITISAETVDFEITNPVFYMLQKEAK